MSKHPAAVLTSAVGTLLALAVALAWMERKTVTGAARHWWDRASA